MLAGDWHAFTIADPRSSLGGRGVVCSGDVCSGPDLHTGSVPGVPACASCTRVGGGRYGLTLGRGARCGCPRFLGY
ncbi:hypothetical protein MRX96_027966 [Rhipicephalus microplus]